MARHKVGEPTRLELLRVLRNFHVTAKEAATLIGISPSNAGHLLRRMTDSGLCERESTGNTSHRLGALYQYRLRPEQVVFK